MVLTVLQITGATGTGKTTLLHKLNEEHPGSIQILTPEKPGQVLNVEAADWAAHATIAIDEVAMWDRATVTSSIASLENHAQTIGKKLILVSQGKEDLELVGVELRSTPAVMHLEGQHQAISLAFDGQNLTFPTI